MRTLSAITSRCWRWRIRTSIPVPGLEGLRNRATGYSILRCNRETREVQVAVWPRWVDPSEPGAKPYPGWPITIKQLDNGLHGAQWTLEEIETPGKRDQVIQVRKEPDGEVVYTVRMSGSLSGRWCASRALTRWWPSTRMVDTARNGRACRLERCDNSEV